MDKKVIAFVTPRMIIGGAETYIITKAYWLINNGFDVIVISSGGENINNLPANVPHFKIEKIDDSPLLFKSEEYKKFIDNVSNILIQNCVDVVEAHNTFPVFHIAMSYKQTGIPFCGNILHELSYVRNPLLAIVTRKLNHYGLYYTLTSEMNTHIEKSIFSKLQPTILPIPVKALSDGSDKTHHNYILSVCRLAEDKMYIKYLIKDFCELYMNNEKLRSYRLVIVGDGPLFEEISILVNKFNNSVHNNVIELKGTVVGSKLEILYKECSAFVGMGTSLLLAASCAKPCIIAGFSKSTEQYSWGYWGENPTDENIIGIGNNHLRIKSSLSEAIEVLIMSTGRALSSGAAARKMFVKHYDFDIIMSRWRDEYFNIIKNYSNNIKLKKSLSFTGRIIFLKALRYIYKTIF